MKNRGKVVHFLFFLVLLCVFVLCSLLVVSFQIHSYHQIVSENEVVQNQSFVASYLRNQVRFHDGINQVRVIHVDNVDVLELSDKMTKTYLYVYEGYLRELYVVDGYKIVLDDGECLFRADLMEVELDGDLLRVVVDDQEVLIGLQCKGGSLGA